MKGFTIIEAMIAVATTVLLSSFVITYSSTGRQQIALSVERAKIVQVISRAKAAALNGYREESTPCGYGVSVDYNQRTYTFFSYRVSDCESIEKIDRKASGYVVKDTYTLGNGVEFGIAPDKLEDVLYMPPDPETLVWSGSSIVSTAIIPIVTTNGSLTGKVKISRAGQISY